MPRHPGEIQFGPGGAGKVASLAEQFGTPLEEIARNGVVASHHSQATGTQQRSGAVIGGLVGPRERALQPPESLGQIAADLPEGSKPACDAERRFAMIF